MVVGARLRQARRLSLLHRYRHEQCSESIEISSMHFPASASSFKRKVGHRMQKLVAGLKVKRKHSTSSWKLAYRIRPKNSIQRAGSSRNFDGLASPLRTG